MVTTLDDTITRRDVDERPAVPRPLSLSDDQIAL